MSRVWPPEVELLKSQSIFLEPMIPNHLETLQRAISDAQLWKSPYGMIPRPNAVRSYIETALEEQKQGKGIPYVVRSNENEFLGVTRFRNIEARRRRLEIGFTWYIPKSQRTHVNSECKLRLLTHAFEELSCMAVEWRIHYLNFNSRRSIERIEAHLDGVLRNYMTMDDGTTADIAVYSIINSEWPTIKMHLQSRVERLATTD